MPAMRFLTAVLAASLALPTAADGLGTIQLLPAGQFKARDGRPGPGKTWQLSDAQGSRVAAALNAIAAQTPVVIDYEHHTLTAQEKGHKAIAAGWIKKVEWKAGEGLFGDVEWTATAKAHIDAKEYQFISPVITYDDAGNVTGVALAALVNYPALLGMDAALSAALSAFTHTSQEQDVTLLAALIAGLGLKAETTEAEAIAAVAALQSQVKAVPAVPTALSTALQLQAGAEVSAALSAVQTLQAAKTTADQQIVALQTEIVQLKNTASGDQVTAIVDKAIADGRLVPSAKDNAISLGRANLAALQGLIETTPVGSYTKPQSGAGAGQGGGSAALNAQQLEVFQSFGISAADAKKYIAAQNA